MIQFSLISVQDCFVPIKYSRLNEFALKLLDILGKLEVIPAFIFFSGDDKNSHV
jgi:hypothetical protein